VSGIFALVIRRTNWETLGQKYTLKRRGKSTSERVIGVLYQLSGIEAMITTRHGKSKNTAHLTLYNNHSLIHRPNPPLWCMFMVYCFPSLFL
jgi:hypothetical protein